MSPPAPPPPPPPPAPVASVTVAPPALTLIPQQTGPLSATPKDASGNALSGRAVTWSSSAQAVATVDANGLVTGAARGSATISATSEGRTGTATITVLEGSSIGAAGGQVSANSGNVTVTIPAAAVPAAIPVSVDPQSSPPADPHLIPGTAYEFGPSGTQFAQPVTIAIKYPASPPAGSTPAQFRVHRWSGTAWTPLPGSTVNTTTRMVTGQTSSFSLYAVLEVPVPVAEVILTPSTTPTVGVGATLHFSATPRDADHHPLDGRTIVWLSTDPGVATISTSGLVTGLAPGFTTIRATSEGHSAEVSLFVFVPAGFAASLEAACGVDEQGIGYCWRTATHPGNATIIQNQFPANPTATSLATRFVAMAAAWGPGCGLTTTGGVTCWINPASTTPYFSTPGPFVALSGGTNSTAYCALRPSGTIACLSGTTANFHLGFTDQTGDGGFMSVDIAAITVCGLKPSGHASCRPIGDGQWTAASPGQEFLELAGTQSGMCGRTATSAYCSIETAQPIPVFPGSSLRRLAAGGPSLCAITQSGQTYCSAIRFDHTATQPVQIAGTFVAITGGTGYFLGLQGDGSLWRWTDNADGTYSAAGLVSSTPHFVGPGAP